MFIQSFEVANLKKLNRMTRLPLVQLLNEAALRPWDFVVAGDARTYADLATPAGLKEVARYADGVGATKNLIVPRDATGKLLAPTTLIDDAHKAGLIVHAWTFRAENQFLPLDFRLGTRTPATQRARRPAEGAGPVLRAGAGRGVLRQPRHRRRRPRLPRLSLTGAFDIETAAAGTPPLPGRPPSHFDHSRTLDQGVCGRGCSSPSTKTSTCSLKKQSSPLIFGHSGIGSG